MDRGGDGETPAGGVLATLENVGRMKAAASSSVVDVALALRSISLELELRAPRATKSKVIFETRVGNDGAHTVNYQRELVKCGKRNCDRWHGPYWYAYWRACGRTRKRYIGKKFRELADLSRMLTANDVALELDK